MVQVNLITQFKVLELLAEIGLREINFHLIFFYPLFIHTTVWMQFCTDIFLWFRSVNIYFNHRMNLMLVHVYV